MSGVSREGLEQNDIGVKGFRVKVLKIRSEFARMLQNAVLRLTKTV